MKKIPFVVSGVSIAFFSMCPRTVGAFGGIQDLIRASYGIVNTLVGIAVACAVVAFLWGIAQTILHGDDSKARKEGRQFMMWSIVALFVMTSVWGLVRYLNDALLQGYGGERIYQGDANRSGTGTFDLPRTI